MSWLALLKVALSAVDYIAKICHDKQLLDAGAAQAIANNAYDSLKKLEAADMARHSVKPDGVPDDPNNRDNH